MHTITKVNIIQPLQILLSRRARHHDSDDHEGVPRTGNVNKERSRLQLLAVAILTPFVRAFAQHNAYEARLQLEQHIIVNGL